MTNGKLFILNDRQYDIIRAGLSVLKQEVIDSQYEAITAGQIDACIKKKLNIEETKTHLEYCKERLNGVPGQLALLGDVCEFYTWHDAKGNVIHEPTYYSED